MVAPFRVLLTVPSLRQEFGGPAVKAPKLARALADHGAHANVVGCGTEGTPNSLPVLGRYHSNDIPRTLRPLRKEVERADVVHILGYREPVSIAAALMARRKGTPYVVEPVGTHRARIRSLGLKRLSDASVGRWVIGDADRVIATSEMEAGELLEDGVAASKVEMRPNGISMDGILPLPRRGAFRNEMGIPPDAPLVLSLGRIAAKKRLADLAHALVDLRAIRAVVAGPDYGDGTLDNLQTMSRALGLENRLWILSGGLWEEQKARALSDADCFCLPSETENFGIAALEAAAVGMPVVISDRCGGAEWLGDSGSVVFPCGDIPSLVRALARVLRDPAPRSRAKSAAPTLRAALDWHALAARQIEIYESCI